MLEAIRCLVRVWVGDWFGGLLRRREAEQCLDFESFREFIVECNICLVRMMHWTPDDDALNSLGEEERLVDLLSSATAIPLTISRVNQVDAARLDVELSAMLKEQLVQVFSLMKPGILFQYEHELDAFLQFLIWRFSIWVDKPTPGNALMNLRYRDERRMETRGKVRTSLEGPGLTVAQKFWYCITTVGGQYTWARLQSFSAFRRWGDLEHRPWAQQAWILVQRLEGFHKAASLANLLLFLYTGKYRNLIERALKARLVYGSSNMNRAVSFEYMNRQTRHQIPLWMIRFAPSAKGALLPHSLPCLVATGTAITVFGHVVQQLPHLGAPDAVCLLLQCSGIPEINISGIYM
ncbi:Peroxisome biogenesis protein 2-like protein [Drosera capensis]